MGCLFPCCDIQIRSSRGETKTTTPSADVHTRVPEIRRSLTPLSCPEATPLTGWRRVIHKSKVKRTLDQYQSPLVRLPPEIRWMIWQFYLCVSQIHVVRIDQGHSRALDTRLAAIKCADQGSDKAESFCNHLCWSKVPCTRTFHAASPKKRKSSLDPIKMSGDQDIGFVSLLRSCRLIYSETISLIYQRNTFSFDHADSIISLSKTILPNRLDLIRSIRFTYHFPYNPYGYVGDLYVDWRGYCSACEILATMSNLEELVIHLHPENLGPHAAAFIVRPLVQIKRPKNFIVHMFVPAGYAEPQFDDSELPFQLVIHNDGGGYGQRRLGEY